MHGKIPPELVGGVVAGAVVLRLLTIIYRCCDVPVRRTAGDVSSAAVTP